MQIRHTVTEKLLIVFLQKLLIVCFVITYGLVPKRKGEEGEWREGPAPPPNYFLPSAPRLLIKS